MDYNWTWIHKFSSVLVCKIALQRRHHFRLRAVEFHLVYLHFQIQDISTVGASDVEFFNLGSDTYLAITQLRSNNGQSLSNSVLYLWNGLTFIQSSLFNSNGASAVDSFTINGNQYLAVANYYDSSLASYEIMWVHLYWSKLESILPW